MGVVMRLSGSGILLACLAASSSGCQNRAHPSAEGIAPGYILLSPLLSTTTYLVDKRGQAVHTWRGELPAISVYLLADGRLLRCAKETSHPIFPLGHGGRLQELDWQGQLLWDWIVPGDTTLQHHDIEPLPNGNVLLIAWEAKSRAEALRAGRHPRRVGPDGLWPDCVLEVRRGRPDGGEIVWKWCLWDHLVQDHDPGRDNYGNPAEHPELIDLNGDRRPLRMTEELLRRLKALGYVGGDPVPADFDADLLHTNSVSYNPRLDQIVLSVPRFNEIWIIDHSTTTAEAAGHSGGNGGMGGDLLYRWGNPSAYGRGTSDDQQLFAQHDAQWIRHGHPGAGNITVFNNGSRRRRPYSSVVEIRLPRDPAGGYPISGSRPFGPARPAWEYSGPQRRRFFAAFISGAQRLANGNTLVTSGPQGHLFEVSPAGEIVWEYDNPYSGDAPNPAGDPPLSLFRATHIPPDHPGLEGRLLSPLEPQPSRWSFREGPA